MSQTPSVGRIVHFFDEDSWSGDGAVMPRAAIITGVVNDSDDVREPVVNLAVLGTSSVTFYHLVIHSDEPQPNRWSWPART